MNKQNRIADLPVNADYYVAPDASPDILLDDVSLWLGYAHGMTRALIEGETVVHDRSGRCAARHCGVDSYGKVLRGAGASAGW